ncbi:hypothetical protein WK07_04450 [Burkholderia multivorans]|uniref:hypothetical protein n=1 Tax=Burkholderia multivorans TaxID=87883 RepID=UPI00075425BE|nr:hypothetical protein [Burkholderia multivorans]KVQ85546.1 hypothetical protein WK07_04450 [Burkholderia multivorans]
MFGEKGAELLYSVVALLRRPNEFRRADLRLERAEPVALLCRLACDPAIACGKLAEVLRFGAHAFDFGSRVHVPLGVV